MNDTIKTLTETTRGPVVTAAHAAYDDARALPRAQVPLALLMDQRAHTLHLALRPPQNERRSFDGDGRSRGVIEVELILAER